MVTRKPITMRPRVRNVVLDTGAADFAAHTTTLAREWISSGRFRGNPEDRLQIGMWTGLYVTAKTNRIHRRSISADARMLYAVPFRKFKLNQDNALDAARQHKKPANATSLTTLRCRDGSVHPQDVVPAQYLLGAVKELRITAT